jgi:predicted nuclease of predicted toxin-antitoxin system
VRFHADENVSEAVAQGLLRRGFDITTTNEVGLRGATDEEQLAYALRESRVMISHDADMLRLASAGTPHAGLAYCHGQKYKVGQLVLKLLALASRLSPQAMDGRVEFL